MKQKGKILAVCISERKGTGKGNVGKARIIENFGLEGDAHAGSERQVSLMDIKSIKESGIDADVGDFGENLVFEGIPIEEFKVGSRILIEGVVLEVTKIGKECIRPCAIYYQLGKCIMPKVGIFARVIEGGTVKTGDEIILE